jgi:hypothetical protein
LQNLINEPIQSNNQKEKDLVLCKERKNYAGKTQNAIYNGVKQNADLNEINFKSKNGIMNANEEFDVKIKFLNQKI